MPTLRKHLGRFLFALIFTLQASIAVADSAALTSGLNWLKTQVHSDGTLSNESASIATSLQVRSETLTTLATLSTIPSAPTNALVSGIAASGDNSTEALSRRVLAGRIAGSDTSGLIATLATRQNDDGGFGGQDGYTSSPLDTAWALLAFQAAGVTAPVPVALDYLQNAQNSNGSYANGGQNPQPPLYITAYVVLAMKPYASQYNLSSALNAAIGFLQGQRSSGNLWGDSIFLTALAYRAVHDFVPQDPTGSDVRTLLTNTQAADGSWANGDPYVTALALQALVMTSVTPQNPGLGIIKGQVIDGQTNLLLDGATVTLSGPTAGTATTAGGGFAFGNLSPGDYSLTITLTNYGTLTTTTVVAAGQTVDFGALVLSKITNPTTGTIRGTVTDAADGSPIADAVVSTGSANATTDTNGNYQISNVAPGSVTVQASANGYAPASGTADLMAGGVLVFSPTLTASSTSGGSAPSTSIQGTITDAATGTALPDVTVTVSGADSASATTDASGQYLITGLAQAGSITVVTALSGYDSISADTMLTLNSKINFSPKLYATGSSPTNANTAGITGIVVDAGSNAPLANATIQASYNSGTVQTLQTGADGRFALNGITSANVDLAVHLDGYVDETTSIPLQPLSIEDIGQIRLRQITAPVLLPDLTITATKRGTAVTDPQALTVNGKVDLTIANKGSANAPSGIEVLAFSDTNLNGIYDPAVDTVLGQATTMAAIEANGKLDLQIPVSGKLPFRDAPISLFVDSKQAIAELDESNNASSTAMGAQVIPKIGTFEPVVKWQWTGGNVITAPIVGPLIDTNGDGKIDQNDIPAVVFISYNGWPDGNCGPVTALSGKDGHLLWQATDPSLCADDTATPALGDIDGDGKPEVIAYLHSGGMVALNGDGTVKWRSKYPPSPGYYDYGAPTIADIDGDGKAEILARNYVINSDGTLRWIGGKSSYLWHGLSAISADIDMDGHPEVIIGNTAYHNDGSVYWHDANLPNYFTSIARFGKDPLPDIVLNAGGEIWLLRHDGSIIWGPVYVPGGGGGAATIADMDGDGKPDIGVAGAQYYTVFNSDGSIKWKSKTSDGSASTGSTVFDLNGDGKAEVFYFDEQKFRVYDGATGNIIFSIKNGSATATEYPVIADVDNDHHADIVVPQNYFGGRGIRVFQDKNNNWVDTRRIWNEYNYHITNVNDDGSIPKVEKNSWQDTNTYRLNALPGHKATAAPDLTASYLRVQDFGGSQPSPLTVRIGNGGGISVPAGISVAFYNGDPANGGLLLGAVKTTQALDSGQFEDVTFNDPDSLSGITNLYAVADDDGSGQHVIPNDFDRSSNTVSLPLSSLPGAFSLTVATDKNDYGPNADVHISASIGNHGSFNSKANVRFVIETADGTATVATLPLQVAVTIPAGGNLSVPTVWNTGTTLAGDYRVKAELVDDQDNPYASAVAPFQIANGQADLAASTVRTDRPVYNATDRVQILSQVQNRSANTVLDHLTLTVNVVDASGTLFTQDVPIAQLPPGMTKDFSVTQQLLNAPPGTYTVKQDLRDHQRTLLSHVETTYQVASSNSTGFGLKGMISASPKTVRPGENVALTASVTDMGNSALDKLPLRIYLVDPKHGRLVHEFDQTSSIKAGKSIPFNKNWHALGSAGTVYTAILVAQVSNGPLSYTRVNAQVNAQGGATAIKAQAIKTQAFNAMANTGSGSNKTSIILAQDTFQVMGESTNLTPIPIERAWIAILAGLILLLGAIPARIAKAKLNRLSRRN
jgi:hypothetical protein